MSLEGIDISHWQAATPSLDGLGFLFARATFGTTPDDRYAQHAAAARAHGLVVGAYAFGVGGDPTAQAAALLKVAAGADLLALDLESNGSGPDMTEASARTFIAAVHAAGHRIGLYHSESGFPSVGQDWNWIANWSHQPAIAWTFWQHRGSPLDLDTFNGTQAQLLTLAGKTPAPAPAPAPKPVPKRYSWHVAHGAAVAIYSLDSHGRIKPGWTHETWTGNASSAPCSAPIHRTTVDGKSGATTVQITKGHFVGKTVQVDPPHTSVTSS